MKLGLVTGLAVLALFQSGICLPAKENLEDTYGDLEGDTNEDMQNDDVDSPPYDDYGDENPNNDPAKVEEEKPAKIESAPETFEKELGDTVVFPCEIRDSSSVRIWYRDESIVYQSDIAMSARPNDRLLPNGALEVSNITQDDAGSYTCSSVISTNNLAKVTHHLIVKTSPAIVGIFAKHNITTLAEGSELTLTCKSTGYPTPVISWYKLKPNNENEPLGTHGENLTISNIRHKEAGRYFCFADNNVGNPAQSYIDIFLNHKPVVTIEKIEVTSENELDTELKCTVQARPQAIVTWLKDGTNVVVDVPHVTLKNTGNDYILMLKELKESDFGKYTCMAKNHMGKTEKVVNLVKTPFVQRFVEPDKPSKDVELTWKVESRSPIKAHELQYRKKDSVEWHTVNPPVQNGENDVYTIKYFLTGLEPGIYEARVRSRNNNGWSQYSESIPFEGTFDEIESHHKHKNKAHKFAKEKIYPDAPNTPENKETRLNEAHIGAVQGSSSNRISITIPLLILTSAALLGH